MTTEANRPALAEVLARLCPDTHCVGWWRSEIEAGQRVRCDARGVATRTASLSWEHATPTGALAALVEAEAVPEHWLDAARAPRWWCEACGGKGDGRWRSTVVVSCPCRGEHRTAPPSHAALVAVASLGAASLARAEAIVAETWPGARLVWRVMTAEALREHHARDGQLAESGAVRATSLEWASVADAFRWPETPPRYIGLGARVQHDAERAWPALRALAALGLHLVALNVGRVVLAVEALS